MTPSLATAPAPTPKMEARELSISYGAKVAVKKVSLRLPDGQVTALIGPSGCGKSTFLRALNRMNELIPGARTEGEILLDGRSVHDRHLDAVELRRRVGMVFQRSNPFPKSIFENVAFGLRVGGVQPEAPFLRDRGHQQHGLGPREALADAHAVAAPERELFYKSLPTVEKRLCLQAWLSLGQPGSPHLPSFHAHSLAVEPLARPAGSH